MNMDKEDLWGLVLVGILIVSALIGVLLELDYRKNFTSEVVPCYDRYGSVIAGDICYTEYSPAGYVFLMLLVGLCFCLVILTTDIYFSRVLFRKQ